jgi:ABC-type lipoprotein release transport system permease subunit
MIRFSPLLARLALRNVRRNPRRSLLTGAAITAGLFCLIVFQALKVGLHREMVNGTVLLDTGDLQVHAAGFEPNLTGLFPLPDPQKVDEALARLGVEAWSPRLKSPALLLAGRHSSSVILSGVVPQSEAKVTDIAGKMVAGSYLGEKGGVVVGAELARSLGAGIGDDVTLMVQGLFGRPVVKKFRIEGLFRTELASFDRSRVYLSLADAQAFLQAQGIVTEIAVRTDSTEVSGLSRMLASELPASRYQVRSWRQIAPDLVQLIELNDATMRLLVLIVFAIVALGIVNTMTMIIYERFRELGILAALGTRPGSIVTLITLESFFLGLISAAAGTVLGVAACAWLGSHGIDLTRFTSANQYFAASHVIRARLLPLDLLRANLLTLATALLAGLYPAWKAIRLHPVEAIRHE